MKPMLLQLVTPAKLPLTFNTKPRINKEIDMPLLIFAVLLIALFVLGPFLVIWAVNTLFPALAIAYSLETWFAVIVVGAFFSPNVTVKMKKD